MPSLNTGGGLTFPSIPFPGYATGFYYPMLATTFNNDGFTLVANKQYYQPFWCRSTTTFSAIVVNQATATTGNLRLGFYAASGGSIGSLVQDIGAVNFPASTGLRTITTSIALTGNTLYFLSYVADAGIKPSGISETTGQTTAQMLHDFGTLDPAVAVLGFAGAVYGAFSYAALPSTPTTPTVQVDHYLSAYLKA